MPDKKEKRRKESESPARLSRNETLALYKEAMQILGRAVNAGKANAVEGLMAMRLMADLLHGGAYAAKISELPYFLPDPTQSPYYMGPIVNSKQGEGIAGFLAGLFAGQNAGDLWQELTMDSNVPHVLPKLLSDEAYAEFSITYAQMTGTDLFVNASTGLKTIVEAATEAIGAVEPEPESAKERIEQTKLLEAILSQAAATEAQTPEEES